MSSQSSSVSFLNDVSRRMPALFTTMSMRFHVSSAVLTIWPVAVGVPLRLEMSEG